MHPRFFQFVSSSEWSAGQIDDKCRITWCAPFFIDMSINPCGFSDIAANPHRAQRDRVTCEEVAIGIKMDE